MNLTENQSQDNQDPASTGSAVVGGPGMSMDANPEPENTETKYAIGGKVFGSREEADAYFANLSKEKDTYENILKNYVSPSAQPTNATQTQEDPDVQIADLMLIDPVAFTKKIIEVASNKGVQVATTTVRSDTMWDRFYTSNPDLKKHKDYVNFKIQTPEIREKTKNLSPDQALKIVEAEVRKDLALSAQEPSGGETLSSGPAMVAGSVQTAKHKQPAPPKKTLSFAEQILERQRKRRA